MSKELLEAMKRFETMLQSIYDENFSDKATRENNAKSYIDEAHLHILFVYLFPKFDKWRNTLADMIFNFADALSKNYREFKKVDAGLYAGVKFAESPSKIKKLLSEIKEHTEEYRRKYGAGLKVPDNIGIENSKFVSDFQKVSRNFLSEFVDLCNFRKGKFSKSDAKMLVNKHF